MHYFAIARKRQFFKSASKLQTLSPCGGSSEQDQQLNTKLRKKIGCLSNLFASIFTTFQVFNGPFLKSVLKNKKKLKYRYGTAVLSYFLAVPVPVPQKYRRYRYRYQKSTTVPVLRYFSTAVLPTYV